jgi:hypothetical protein
MNTLRPRQKAPSSIANTQRWSTRDTWSALYVPMPILKALYHVTPNRVLAEGSAAVWTIQIQGKHADGSPFTTSSMCNYSGEWERGGPMRMIEARMPIGPA